MAQKKKKRNRDNREKHERQTKSMKKTRRKKKEKEKETKNRKWDLKSGQNGRYKNGEKKVGFLFSKKQTNERNEKERKVLWKEKRKWWTRKRTSNKEDRTETKMIISPKEGSKQRDQNKESKNRKRHTLEGRRFWKNDVHKKYVNNNKKGEHTREKTKAKKHRKKKQEMNKKE